MTLGIVISSNNVETVCTGFRLSNFVLDKGDDGRAFLRWPRVSNPRGWIWAHSP